MVAILPALFSARPGREKVLFKVAGEVVADGATGVNTPLASSFPGITVAAGDIIARGAIKELVVQGVSDHAGTVHVTNHVQGGTAVAGTVASLALVANVQNGTIAVLSGTVASIGFKFINAAGAAGTVTAEVRGR